MSFDAQPPTRCTLYAGTRRRLLAAMGVPLTALALACRSGGPEAATSVPEAPPPDPAADVPRAQTPTGTPASQPSAGYASDLPRGVSCPSGEFCVAAPAEAPPHPAEGDRRCAATVPVPGRTIREHSVHYDPVGTERARVTDPSACCYTWIKPCGGGRALRDAEGAPMATPAGPAAGWAPLVEDRPVRSAPARAAYWLEQAGYEHASVASFARTTLELLALGAPADLVRDTQLAALDEVRHAQALYAVARSLGARDPGPGPVTTDRPLARDLVSFAVATFEDACIGETVGALAAQRAAETAEDPELARVLSAIAVDEDRHAALAWRTLAWATRRGGEAVAHAVRQRVLVLEGALNAAPVIAHAPGVSRDGRLDAASVADNSRRALAEVVIPCARALLS